MANAAEGAADTAAEAQQEAEQEVEQETQDAGLASAEDAGLDAGVAAVARPEFLVPAYAAAPPACEPHPELAPETALRQRDLDRGVPEFPMVHAVNAACEQDPAELAASFNRGGLRLYTE